MNELIERAIVASTLKEEKTIGSILSYGIIRTASGVFSVRMYWRGRTKKGDSRYAMVELDANPKTAMVAIVAMEKLMSEAKEVNIIEKLRAIGIQEIKEEDKDKINFFPEEDRKKSMLNKKEYKNDGSGW